MHEQARPEDGGAETPGEAVGELLSGLLRRSYLNAPADLASVVSEQARVIGVRNVELYLVDYDQQTLVPLRSGPADHREPLSVGGTVAGRSFGGTAILEAPRHAGRDRRFWFPLLDGTDRVGVMGLSFPPGDVPAWKLVAGERYAHLVAMLVVTKGAYGDTFELPRRRRPMTVASELLWRLVPPLVFATDRIVVAGLLEPCYDNGGDAFDYALDGDVMHLAVFDAMGHGLVAARAAALAIAAYRRSRRRGDGLAQTYEAMDRVLADQFADDRFVTALLGQLDVSTGELAWIAAGHPPPVVIRQGRRRRVLSAQAVAMPLGAGLPQPRPAVARESLEPGDLLLLYTDGLTEARARTGERLSLDGLTAFVEREASSGHPAPETLRRLRQAIVGEREASLEDDASALLVEWHRGAEQALLPETVAEPR